MEETIKINNSAQKKPKVLVAPLDWGLGHATRCIPIINQLLIAGCEVIIGSERAQKKLLQQEFPYLRFAELRGYRLKYGNKRLQTLLKIIFQIPKILIQINYENRWLRQLMREENIDAVISDNRYGLYSSKLFSVFITHQLCIQTPFGKMVERKLQKINYRFINKFDSCWVPDFEKKNILAGKLSHPKELPKTPVYYIGLLSRFEKIKTLPEKKSILILLSGPEPQRTIFEKLLLQQFKKIVGKVILVRGLPGEKTVSIIIPGIETYNHLSSADLNKIICESDFIISRSGYSTVMDLVKLGCKSILVPTPGQPEQEYLATFLLKNKIAYSITQDNFSLSDAIENARQFSFIQKEYVDIGLLKSAIEGLIKR